MNVKVSAGFFAILFALFIFAWIISCCKKMENSMINRPRVSLRIFRRRHRLAPDIEEVHRL